MPTILVVEDHPDIRSVIGELIEELGYTVKRAADGVDAIAIMQQGDVDLLYSDVRLGHGGPDGVMLARLADQLRIRVILTTGYSSALLELRGKVPWTVLEKPVTLNTMREKFFEKLGTVA